MSILQSSDFIGQYRISKDCFSELQTYIDKYEKYYLLRLLGADLYGLFIADLTVTTPQVPQTAIYISLFDAFEIDDTNDCLRISEGMKAMLTQFIYFQFLRDQPNKKKIGGVYRTEVETGMNLGYNGYNLVEAYNQGVGNYKEIQWYICEYDTDYPEENTQLLEYTGGI